MKKTIKIILVILLIVSVIVIFYGCSMLLYGDWLNITSLSNISHPLYRFFVQERIILPAIAVTAITAILLAITE